MDTVIAAEGLGKRYSLEHLSGGSPSTFREVLAGGLQRLGRRFARRSPETGAEEDFWALRDLDFQIREGEKVGIIGHNGAGKSTLLKIMSRIIDPTVGRVRLRGRVASLLEVGTGFHPELTGRENIFFNGVILGMTRAEIRARFDEIVAFAEIEKFLDTPVKHYSSGMYVRLGFAVASNVDSEILIVDEALAVGDVQFQKKCLGKMEEIGREGRTVLFVSHNMNSVLQLTERAMLLERGRLLAFAPTAESVTLYLKLHEQAREAKNQGAMVPWLKVDGFQCERSSPVQDFNEALRFRLDLSLDRPVPSLLLTLNLRNTVGAHLVTACGMLDPMAAGEQSLCLELSDHRLLPGTYFVQLVLWREQDLLFRADEIASLDLLVRDDGRDAALSPLLVRNNDRRGCFCPVRVVDGGGAPDGGD